MKENDWIIATLNNPDFTPLDFKNLADMNTENTQFLPLEQYLENEDIQKLFLLKDSFKSFYAEQAKKFGEFASEDAFEYDMWDVTKPKDSKVKDPEFLMFTMPNPDHISIGVAGPNVTSNSNKSKREWALKQKIYDSSTGLYLDYSVDDISLTNNPLAYFKSLFGEPLVYATYDEDTIEKDPYTGEEILHKKGEWKVNENNEYYVETLGDRSLIGKLVVSVSDYLTPEDNALNKYDFLDSDGLDKSVTGTIMKNLVAVAPLLNPYSGAIYSGLLVAREMSKSLPMLYGMIESFLGNPNPESKLANKYAAYGEKFTTSTSDYALENIFAFENIGNLAGEVGLLWGQLRFIVNAYNKIASGYNNGLKSAYAKAEKLYTNKAKLALQDSKIGKLEKDLLVSKVGGVNESEIDLLIKSGAWAKTLYGEQAINTFLPAALTAMASKIRMGLDLSLAYMAIISNTDVYLSVLDKGGTPMEAASIALGSAIGMFLVDKKLGLGEMFFLSDEVKRAVREGWLNEAKNIVGSASTKQESLNLILRAVRASEKFLTDYHSKAKDHTLGFIGKSIGEGLEEVSEELVADTSKWIGELAGKFGYASQTDYGAFENPLDRYIMSMLGGTIGGGLFYGVDLYQNRNLHKQLDETLKELIYLISNHKKEDLMRELDRLHKKGKLGSTSLSQTTDENGNPIFVTADKNHESLNDFVYKRLKAIYNHLDAILEGNKVNLSENQLFDKLVLSDTRIKALLDYLLGKSYATMYLEDFRDLTNKIALKEEEIRLKMSEVKDTSKAHDKLYLDLLDALLDEKKELLKLRDAFLSGEVSMPYLRKLMFAIDPRISGDFLIANINQYARINTGLAYSELSEATRKLIDIEYAKYVKDKKKTSLDEAFKLYEQLELLLLSDIDELNSYDIEGLYSELKELINNFPKYQSYDYNERLENESDEDYNDRNTLREGESDLQFIERKSNRENLLRSKIYDNFGKAVSELLSNKYLIDTSTARRLSILLGHRKNDFKLLLIDLILFSHLDLELIETIKKIIFNSNTYSDAINEIVKFRRNNLKNLLKSLTIKPVEGIEFKYNASELGGWDFLRDENGNVVTIKDLIDVIDYDINEGNVTSDLDSIKDYLTGFDFSEETASNLALLYDIAKNRDDLNDVIIEISDTSINQNILLLNINSSNILNEFKTTLDQIYDDPIYKAFQDIDKLYIIENPAIQLLSKISAKFENVDVNIEEFLLKLQDRRLNIENLLDFKLTPDEINTLRTLQYNILQAKAVLYAASKPDNENNPVGHNKYLNNFIKRHKLKTDSFIEIDENLGNVYLAELDLYNSEITEWLTRASNNSINRADMFLEADNRLNEQLSLFYRSLNQVSTIKDVNILEGYSEGMSVLESERLLYDNVLKAINEGKLTFNDVLEIIPKISKIENVLIQKSTKLDHNLLYLTDYDKFKYFVSTISMPIDVYRARLKEFISNNLNKIVPIGLLMYAARMLYTVKYAPEKVNLALEYIALKCKETGLPNLPILYNTGIGTGVGGAGKTEVEARIIADNEENVWITGPLKQQRDGLKSKLPNATVIEDIIKHILADNIADVEKLRVGVHANNLYTLTPGIDKGNIAFHLKEGVLKFNSFDKLPSTIVIDEASHYTNLELQIISQFCKENNINLTLLGDENLAGADSSEYGNFNKEIMLAWRAPDLFISLRVTNRQKYYNQIGLLEIELTLLNAIGVTQNEQALKLVKETLLPKFKFKVHNGEDISGELIVDKLTPELANKLKGKDVGYIGTDIDQELTNAGVDIKDGPLSIKNIQGKEYDYVVVNLDWSKLDLNNIFYTALWFRDLYTAISRSRKGTIIINNGLTNFIKLLVENTTGDVTSIYDSAKLFLEKALADLSDIKTNYVQEQKSEEPDEPLDTDDVIEKLNKDFKHEEDKTDELPNGIRVYTNYSSRGVISDESKTWIGNNNNTDLGIFLKEGLTVSTLEEKYNLTLKLLKLKLLILTDSNIINLFLRRVNDDEVINVFQKGNIKYYVRVSDASSDNRLTGLTGLDNNKRTIVNGKIYTLIAKIDDTYTVTLGALTNPDTWRAFAQTLPNSNLIETKIIDYENHLKSITSDVEVNITAKALSQLITKDSDGNKLNETVLSPNYDNQHPFIVRSDVKFITKPIPGISESLVGKPVILESSNVLLNKNELLELYIRDKEDQAKALANNEPYESKYGIRLIPLHSKGISFRSLSLSRYKSIYTRADSKNTFPFFNMPVAIRMYTAAWNFRANLIRFNRALDDFIKQNNIDNIEELTQKYLQEYIRIKGDRKSLTEEEFLNEIKSQDIYNEIKPIFDFNESILDIRQFRLGYDNNNGVRVQAINSTLYSEITNRKPLGLVINYSLALQYENALNAMFENVFDKFFTLNLSPDTLLDMKKTFTKKWFSTVKDDVTMDVVLLDESNAKIEFANNNIVMYLPLMLSLVSKRIHNAMYDGLDKFKQELEANDNLRLLLNAGSENIEISYIPIIEALGLKQTFTDGTYVEDIGIKPYINGKGSIDRRLDNLFSLMFHGLVELTNDEDFTKDKDLRADDAMFKYGIFADTFGSPVRSNTNGDYFGSVSTNEALYTCDAFVGMPVISIDFVPTTSQVKAPEVTSNIDTFKATIISKLNAANINNLDNYISKLNSELEIIDFINEQLKLDIINKILLGDNSDITTWYGSITTTGDLIPYFIDVIESELDLNGIRTIKTSDNKMYKVIVGTSGNIEQIEIPDKTLIHTKTYKELWGDLYNVLKNNGIDEDFIENILSDTIDVNLLEDSITNKEDLNRIKNALIDKCELLVDDTDNFIQALENEIEITLCK